MPEKTKEDFFKGEDGTRWFRTGDIGEIYEDGTLKIIDRKKDLVKLPYGEYVSLGKVESILKTCPLVENICIYGDATKNFCVALLVPDRNKLTTAAEKIGINQEFEQLCSNPALNQQILKVTYTVARGVKSLSPVQEIRISNLGQGDMGCFFVLSVTVLAYLFMLLYLSFFGWTFFQFMFF